MSRRLSSFRSKRLKTKRQKVVIYKYFSATLFFVLLVIGLSWLSRADFARVNNIAVVGNSLVQKEAVEKIVTDTLNTSFLWIFSKNNPVLFSRSRVENEIYKQFATVGAVSVAFSGLKTIVVHIKEYEPAYLWCDYLTHDACYFMDSNGYIFSESAEFSKGVLRTYYGLVSSSSPVGSTYIEPVKFTALNKFIESLKLLKFFPAGVNTRSPGDYELTLVSGGSILFSDNEDYLKTFENLETIINQQTLTHKNFHSQLEYVDVRFNSKVFIKLKHSEVQI